MANRKNSRDDVTRSAGVSTAADVRTFRTANTALTHRVTASKHAAQSYVRELEKRAGIAPKKK